MGAVVVLLGRLASGGFDMTLNGGRRGSKADVGCRWVVRRVCGQRR